MARPQPPTFSQIQPEYARLWRDMQVRAEHRGAVDAIARRIIAGRARYVTVSAATGVPWAIIGVIHALECSLSFAHHLHNGDPLSDRTVQVPAGRPKAGRPPYTWEVSAADALRYDGLDKVTDWSPERVAYELEGYNGWGYRLYRRGMPSPYLWSFSNHYTRGKYSADGKFDPALVSQQCGAMLILKRILEMGAFKFQSASLALEGVRTTMIGSDPSQSPSVEQIRFVQERLRALGYSETGNVDGDFGQRTRAGILAFRSDNALPLVPAIDADLIVALAGAKPRPIADTRSNATPAEVAAKVPAVEAAQSASRWAGAQGIGASAIVVASGILDSLPSAQSALEPVKALLGSVPLWAWGLAVVTVSYVLWRRSRAAVSDTVDAYRDARLM